MRLWQFPYSTNVERVALALGFKGLEAEPVVIDPADRSRVRALSGQDLVPVLEHDGEVINGSLEIVAHLEERFPEPTLLPPELPRRAELQLLCDWFDRVWKRPPNLLAEALDAGRDPSEPELQAWAAELRASLDLFQALLSDGREHLLGAEFTIAEVAVFPFLRYGVGADEADDETFHLVLVEHLALESRHAALRDWIDRVDRQPRAGMVPATGRMES
jgi:glutathione S-transferase